MMPTLPIACDLAALSPEGRRREQVLLAEFRGRFGAARDTATGFEVEVGDDSAVLGRILEFIGLERLCCPFLDFDLTFAAARGPVTLHVHGGDGVKVFVRSVFLDRA